MTTPPRTPTTLDAAWEALAADIHANGYSVRDAIARHRPLIEAEAIAAERARIRAAVEDVPWSGDPYCCGELRAAVIALLDPRP